MSTPIDIESIAKSLTETQAIDLHQRLARQFGWAGSFFTRDDAYYMWNDDEYGPLTDEAWEDIRNHRSWRKVIAELMVEQGWEVVSEVVSEVAHSRKEG